MSQEVLYLKGGKNFVCVIMYFHLNKNKYINSIKHTKKFINYWIIS